MTEIEIRNLLAELLGIKGYGIYKEGHGYYRQDSCGYVGIEHAGRFTQEEAEREQRHCAPGEIDVVKLDPPPLTLDLVHACAMKFRDESTFDYVRYGAQLNRIVNEYNSTQLFSISMHDALVEHRAEAILRAKRLWREPTSN